MTGTSKHQSLRGKETLASHLASQSSPALPPLLPAVSRGTRTTLGRARRSQVQKVPRGRGGQRVIGALNLGQKGLVSVQFWTPCKVLTGLPFLGTSFLVMTSRRPEQPQAHRPRLLPCTVGGLLTSGPAQSKRNGRCSGCRARGRPGGGCAQKALPSAAGLPLGLRLERDLPWGSRPEGTQAVSPGHGHLHLSLPAAPLSCEPPKTCGLARQAL